MCSDYLKHHDLVLCVKLYVANCAGNMFFNTITPTKPTAKCHSLAHQSHLLIIRIISTKPRSEIIQPSNCHPCLPVK